MIGAGSVLYVSTSSHKPNTLSRNHIPIYTFVIKTNNFKNILPFILKSLTWILGNGVRFAMCFDR